MPGERHARAARTRMQMIFQDPISSLNPRRKVRDIVMEPLTIWKRGTERGARASSSTGRSRRSASTRRGPPRARPTSSPAASASASRSPGRSCSTRADHLRRAGVGARRERPGPGAEPARGPQGPPRADADLHRPRPRRGQEHQRPGRRDVPRQAVRGRAERRPVRRPGAPLHERAAGVDPGARPGGRDVERSR